MYLEKMKDYWNQRAYGYSQSTHEELKGNNFEYYTQILTDGAPAGSALKCLDIGCGPGLFSSILAKMGHSVTAFDYSEEMLEQAKMNFKECSVSVEAVQGDAQNLPFEDNSFDYIVSRNVMWGMEFPARAYSEWLRVLCPGGRMMILDANHYLHYYDEEYRMAWEVKTYHHDTDTNYGVDPTPINEIARDLPLSHEHRPNWDVNTLLNLGATRVVATVSREPYYNIKTGKENTLITYFMISAEKVADRKQLSDFEKQRQIDSTWSRGSNNYSSIIDNELSSFRVNAWQKKILTNAPDKPVLDILDAGCGPGFFSIILSQLGHRVTGLDGSDGMLNHAANKAVAHGTRPLFLKGDCHNLPFADQSFDLVISRNVTHALRDNKQVYAEWKRVLRPGGVLLIFDANWHLTITDPEYLADFRIREDKCFARYGTNFNQGKRETNESSKAHRLGTVIRPSWDIEILEQLGYLQVTAEEDITGDLWDEKEKLLYGGTPMFMIRAKR